MACSPRHRILAWVLLCRRFQRLSRRPRKGTRTWRPAPLVRLVRPALQPCRCERVDDAVFARGGQVVGGAGQGRGSPQQSAEGIRDDLDVHAVALVFSGVVRGVGGDPVDGQEGAVQDHVRLRPDGRHCLGQGLRLGGQHFDGLAYVAVDSRDADLEPCGELGVRVAASQVGQGEQGLTADGQTPPSRTYLPPVSGQLPRQVPQRAAGQIDRRRVDKHAKLLADTGDLGREPVYQELRRSVQPMPTNTPTPQPGWKGLTDYGTEALAGHTRTPSKSHSTASTSK